MTDFTPPPLADFGRRLCGKRGVDRVEGRDDKLEQQEGNCWKNVQVGKARSRGPGTEKGWCAQQCARPGEGHNQHQPLGGETTALLCSTNDDPDSSRCKLVQERERWRCVLFEKWAANRLAMLESTPRRLLCLREPFSQQSSRVPATLDNVGQYGHRRLGDEA